MLTGGCNIQHGKIADLNASCPELIMKPCVLSLYLNLKYSYKKPFKIYSIEVNIVIFTLVILY